MQACCGTGPRPFRNHAKQNAAQPATLPPQQHEPALTSGLMSCKCPASQQEWPTALAPNLPWACLLELHTPSAGHWAVIRDEAHVLHLPRQSASGIWGWGAVQTGPASAGGHNDLTSSSYSQRRRRGKLNAGMTLSMLDARDGRGPGTPVSCWQSCSP